MAIDVTIETKVIDTSEENLRVDEEARQFQKESWPIRRDNFKRQRSTEINMNEIKTEDWLNIVRDTNVEKGALMILIDGMFVHSAAVHYAKKYIDYKKFRAGFGDLVEKIHYFSCNQESDKITRFLNYIDSIPGFEVIVKVIPKTMDQRDKKATHPAYKSVAVDMAVASLREAYDSPEVQHVLILSRDPEILPVIRELKDLELKIAIARSGDIPTSRSLFLEVDYVIDIYELFSTLDCYSAAEIKKPAETTESNGDTKNDTE